MSNADHIHNTLAIINEVNNSIVADPNSMPVCPLQLYSAPRTWFFFQGKELLPDPSCNSEGKPVQLALCSGLESNGIDDYLPP